VTPPRRARIADTDRLALEALRLLVRQVVRDELHGAAPATSAPEGFLGTTEAARRTGVGADAVLGWIAKGLLPATKPPGTKSWRIRPAELDAFLTESRRLRSPCSPRLYAAGLQPPSRVTSSLMGCEDGA